MKILLTSGGSGGHFYPVIAVAQAIHDRVATRKILPPELYYMSNKPYSERTLYDNDIKFIPISAGKMRRYFSVLNFLDMFRTAFGCISALIKIYRMYPDVIFGKGGYPSFPALFAAKILRIPVVIHESDSHPGRVNLWAGRFAKKIAISYPSAAKFFGARAQDKIAFTGNPIRAEVAMPLRNGAHELLKLEPNIPVVFIIGGSQGSGKINDIILEALPDLLDKYQIIHQTGKANLKQIESTATVVLKDNPLKHRYHPYDYLNELTLRMSAGVADIIISRGGAGAISEIAAWGVPSIIIPISESVSHDQTSNAFAYAATGAASVIEEDNLHAHILIGEINRILGNKEQLESMRRGAVGFARLDSATLIANVILDIALEHER